MKQINFFELFEQDPVGHMVVAAWANSFDYTEFCYTFYGKIDELDYYIDEDIFNKMIGLLDDHLWTYENILSK